MKPEIWAEIRRLALLEKLSKSEIGRRLSLDRKTVRSALLSESGAPIRESAGRISKLDIHKPYIEERLREYPHLSATRLFEEIKRHGYTGGITILKDFVATLRNRTNEAFFRLETLPGEQAQVDWANCGVIRIGEAVRKLSAFVMVLSYSRLMYVELTLSQCFEDFLACHLNAFQFCGGIPQKILYDNLKSVCLYRSGTDIRLNPKFMEFAGACLFEPRLCRPRRGNEKGKVERSIQYLRGSFLDGRTESSYPSLKRDLSVWLETVANERLHSTTREKPVVRHAKEKDILRPLPNPLPDVSIFRAVHATTQSLVSFDGNRYSTPFRHAGKVLTIKASMQEVHIFDGGSLVAKHPRSFERGTVIENPKHYEGLLATKKAAEGAKVVDRFLGLAGESPEWKTLLENYLSGLTQSNLNVHHHLKEIVKLSGLYGSVEIIQASSKAIEYKAFGISYLANLILQQRAARGLPDPRPIQIPTKPQWTHETVEECNLSLYDELMTEEKKA